MKNNTIRGLYTGLVLLFLLIPFVCTFFVPTTKTTENKELAAFPSLTEDGKWNVSFFSDLGAYFEDHFAFRQQLVTANAKLRSSLLHTSAADNVIVGEDGWLYYAGTLDDYQGTNQLSDRSLYNIAHNLSLMQGMTEAMGAKFFYTIAPNKNTLYGENMPYNYIEGQTGNLERLLPYLESEGVSYIDLTAAFREQDEVLYLLRDSHWNNKGAVLAYDRILDAMGHPHDDYADTPFETKTDYIGDLNAMLFPLCAEPEPNQQYSIRHTYRYVSEEKQPDADLAEAYNPEGTGSVLVYRDSFGNTLFPLFANAFEKTRFTQLVPYSLSDISLCDPDYVLVERVERRIASVIEDPPIMQGPSSFVSPKQELATDTTIHTRRNGSYLVIEGEIDPDCLDTDTRIYVSVHPSGVPAETAYEAFGRLIEKKNGETSDCGYQLYLMEHNVPEAADYDIEIMTADGGHVTTVAKITVSEGEER